MAPITLTSTFSSNETSIPNIFLDTFMPTANGEFVKVYLCLLRLFSDPKHKQATLTDIADLLNHTEGDVVRAIKYWEKMGLLSVTYANDTPVSITILPMSGEEQFSYSIKPTPVVSPVIAKQARMKAEVQSDMSSHVQTEVQSELQTVAQTDEAVDSECPVKTSYTAAQIKRLRADENVEQLLYVAETLIGKTLTPSESTTILYIYNDLHFSEDLIEYLIEYCVSNEKRSLRYIESVAINWHKEGITTAAQAKNNHEVHSKKVNSVMKAFGLNDRRPGQPEMDYITRWYDDYGFESDIVIEACNRTIRSLHKPNFEYADTILSNWRKKDVHSLSDIASIDANRTTKKPVAATVSTTASTGSVTSSNNRFNHYPQREYDFAALEKKLVSKRDN